jgi:hypothetical protein
VDLDDICRDTGLNVKTVKGAFKRLQAAGFSQRKRRFKASRFTMTTVPVQAAEAAEDRRVRGRKTRVYEQSSQLALTYSPLRHPQISKIAPIPQREDDDVYDRMARRMTGKKVGSGTDFCG